MSLRFDHPEWLWVAAAAAPLVALGAWRLRGDEAGRRIVILSLRALLVLLLAAALARPTLVRTHDDLAVVALLDVSQSVRRFGHAGERSDGPASILATMRDWMRRAAMHRRADDRLGVVVFDGRSAVIAAPRRAGDVVDEVDLTMAEGTDIAGAVRLGLALFPADANRRLVLVSDGNQTIGDALAAAREAAASPRGAVPIDVVPIAYRAGPDAQIVRLEAPPTARSGQSIALRAVMESTAPVRGRITLLREGRVVDLVGDGVSTSRTIVAPAGSSVQVLVVAADDRPVQRFAAIFEPDDGADDALVDNNRAEAVVTNPDSGAVLVIRGERRAGPRGAAEPGAPARPFETLVRAAGRQVVSGAADILPRDLLTLQAFDLVVLDDVAAGEVEPAQQRLLAEYVDRLGGGLIMSGGPHAFGAGGWKGSPVERILPVRLELPRQLRAPRAALILVLDKSGSMAYPVAGANASQQAIANEAAALAIESLAARSWIGVIAFDSEARTVVPLQVNDDPATIAAAVRGIQPVGGTDIAAGLEAARRMMRGAGEVEQRKIVFLTDGRSQSAPVEALVDELVAEGVSITTIAVGDDTDEELLRRMAERGRGEFHAVRNARTLPRVLVDSVQVVNQPLVDETPFLAQPLPTGSRFVVDAAGAPPLGGLVLTSARDEPTAVVELTSPSEAPVLAHWPAGLGRVVAFTSDLDGPWSAEWLGWAGWARLWSDLVRFAARPGGAAGLSLSARIEGDALVAVLTIDDDPPGEGADEGHPAIDPIRLSVDGLVYAPDGTATPVRLRQVAPRRFEAQVDARTPGPHVVALTPRDGERPLAPLVAGATRGAGAEFQRHRSNIALLREMASITGGRLLAMTPGDGQDDPAVADLFDRDAMAPVSAARPIWPWLLWAALAVLLLDVAARRIAWQPSAVRSAMRRAAEHAPGPASIKAAATLGRLRGAAESLDAGPRIASDDAVRTAALAETAAQAARHREQRRMAARQGPSAAPSDVGVRGAPGAPAQASPGADTTPQGSDRVGPASADDDQGASTAGLLEAKRRARRRIDGG